MCLIVLSSCCTCYCLFTVYCCFAVVCVAGDFVVCFGVGCYVCLVAGVVYAVLN